MCQKRDWTHLLGIHFDVYIIMKKCVANIEGNTIKRGYTKLHTIINSFLIHLLVIANDHKDRCDVSLFNMHIHTRSGVNRIGEEYSHRRKNVNFPLAFILTQLTG